MSYIMKNGKRHGGGGNSNTILFNNSITGIKATNVQDAIDEVYGTFMTNPVIESQNGEFTSGSVPFEPSFITAEVIFEKPFSSIPTVIASIVDTGDINWAMYGYVKITAITCSGFLIEVHNTGPTYYRQFKIVWSASSSLVNPREWAPLSSGTGNTNDISVPTGVSINEIYVEIDNNNVIVPYYIKGNPFKSGKIYKNGGYHPNETYLTTLEFPTDSSKVITTFSVNGTNIEHTANIFFR